MLYKDQGHLTEEDVLQRANPVRDCRLPKASELVCDDTPARQHQLLSSGRLLLYDSFLGIVANLDR